MKKKCGCGLGLDIELAREVQQLLFPKSSPVCSWCCIGIKNRMALGLGGDYFEFITMPDDCQVFLIGDVTGHGLQASVVMSLIYGFIHHSVQQKYQPLETINQVNGFLRTFAKRSRKIDQYFSTTLFYGVVDPDSLEMRYVNAGHVPPLIRRGSQVLQLAATGQPLGFFDHPEMEERTFTFERGDRLLLYTDGIIETYNEKGEFFGRDRLEKALLAHDGDHLELLEQIYQRLEEFDGSGPPEDDCTAIVMDINGLM